MTSENLPACPLCTRTSLTPLLTAKDYTVSLQSFTVVTCPDCSFTFTNPRPGPAEIPAYYKSEKYISHTGGTTGLMDRLYRLARNYTLRWKAKVVGARTQKKVILDYGCGTGDFLAYLTQHGWQTTGIEPDDEARRKAAAKGINVSATFSREQQRFPVITLWHVLEHVHTLTHTLTELKSRLDTSGTIFIAVPNYKSADARYYGEHWAAYDVPRHLWHFNKNTMARTLTQAGFKIEAVLPMKLDAYYVSLLSELYRHPKASLFTRYLHAGLQAWKSNRAARKTGEYSSLIYIAKHL